MGGESRRRQIPECFPILAVIPLALLFFAACHTRSQPTPMAIFPTVTVGKIISSHTTNTVLPGEIIGLSLDITTSGPVTISWDVDSQGGDILGGQETAAITYRAPTEPGFYSVRVRVECANSSIERSFLVEVKLPPTEMPTPPNDTPTPTSTLTPTATPTSTPTPTNMPTAAPTQTPTPIDTPTPAPTPPEAIVVATNGLELRSGPGTNYDPIGTLPNGTTLDILRRVIGKNDWIKVSVTPDSSKRIEGWMNIAPESIRINVKLDDIPLMYEFGPKLYEPEPFADRPVDEMITFKWQDYGPLEEHQYYSIILVLDGLSDEHSCYHGQTKEPGVSFKPKDYGCIRGDYHWGVSIATNLACGRGEPNWRDDTERDERNPIGIGIPYSGGPKDKVTPTSIHGEPPGD